MASTYMQFAGKRLALYVLTAHGGGNDRGGGFAAHGGVVGVGVNVRGVLVAVVLVVSLCVRWCACQLHAIAAILTRTLLLRWVKIN